MPRHAATYLIRHAMASMLVLAASLVLAGLIYAFLLVVAMVGNASLGGPFALPWMLLLAATAAMIANIGVFAPVTAITETLWGRARPPRLRQFVIASLLLVSEIGLATTAVGAALHKPVGVWLLYGITTGVTLLLPFGLYWGALQMLDGLYLIIGKAWHLITRRQAEIRTR